MEILNNECSTNSIGIISKGDQARDVIKLEVHVRAKGE